AATAARATRVSLLRWLRGQLRQPEPLRERLEAAIAEDDPTEARRIVERFAFPTPSRRSPHRRLGIQRTHVFQRTRLARVPSTLETRVYVPEARSADRKQTRQTAESEEGLVAQ